MGLSTTTKGKLGAKAAKLAAENPRATRLGAMTAFPAGKVGLKVGKPLITRRARQRAERIGDAARTAGATIVAWPRVAYELGLAEPPKPKRTAPRVAAGVVIGAGAMYLFEPEHGHEHRRKVAQLVS
jgi:hypothetical protein